MPCGTSFDGESASVPSRAIKGPVMRKRLSVLWVTAAVVSGLGMFTQAAPGLGQIDRAASTGTAQAAPPASTPSTTLRLRGTIDKYDPSTRVLSLSTSNGIVQFPLASTARIRQRRDRIDATALEKLAGYRAAIRYSEAGGRKTVESVQVFGKNERTER
jgi:hypothetical protein